MSMDDSTARTISIAPLIRHSQSLQLCAIMTINNLLQINIHPHSAANGYPTEHVMLCGRKCYRYRHDESSIPPAMATKSELDRIADALVLQEAAVLRGSAVGTDGMDGGDGGELSYWKVLQGHHRTPLLGNYSFEVRSEK